ncbi:MAG: hypothetical protein P8M53_04180 [Pirellulales bacterium]|nr:hypothetical protein [Pirellulales bacterium]
MNWLAGCGLGLRVVVALFIIAFINLSGWNLSGWMEANAQPLDGAPGLLSIQYALQEEATILRVPATVMLSETLPHTNIASTPEPYSYVLAAFGVFGILAMGSVFRRRKNPNKPIDKRTRMSSRTLKYRQTMSR